MATKKLKPVSPEPKFGDIDPDANGPVRELQEGLAKQGYYTDDVDGKFFGKTLEAVNAFRAAEGLDPLPTPEPPAKVPVVVAPLLHPPLPVVTELEAKKLDLVLPEKLTAPGEKTDPTKMGPVLDYLSDDQRRALFGQYQFRPYPAQVAGQEITILNDVKTGRNWEDENIRLVFCPQLKGVPFFSPKNTVVCNGSVRMHKAISQQFLAMMQAIQDAGLLKLIITFEGAFVPRYKRPSKTSLSNHAYGTAFDFNAFANGMGVEPAAVGEKGSLRQLVPFFEAYGFYWGGYWKGKDCDGMHVEAAKVLGLVSKPK